jgi:DNA mismatch endonuclease Vsr
MKRQIRNNLNRDFSRKRGSDRLTIDERSRRMSLVRSTSTMLERDFITVLKKQTRKNFTINDVDVLGKPDIVFKKYKVCVFLDSNFWHGWQYPRWKHLLKDDFWRGKIERNRKRDKRVSRKLHVDGWVVLRFWEHQLKKDQTGCVKKVVDSLKEE